MPCAAARCLLCLAICAGGCGGIAVIEVDETSPHGSGTGGDAAGGSNAFGGESPCGDLSSDPHDCGACDHDCLGGQCLDGRCQPVVIGSGFKATDLVLVEDRLFVTSVTGEVRAGPKLGSVEPWTSGDDQAFAVMAYQDGIAWSGNGSLWRADLATGSATRLAQHGKRAFDIAGGNSDSGILYSDYAGFTGVWQLPAGGAEPISLATDFFAHGFLLRNGVKDWSRLYYFSEAGLVELHLAPDVTRTVLVGPGLPGMNDPIVLAESASELIWTQGLAAATGGGLYRWSSGGSPQLIAAIEVAIGVALRDDGERPLAFVTSYDDPGDPLDGSLWQIDRSTGETVLLAEGLHDPSLVTADADAIYWIEQDEQRAVVRLAR